MRHLLALLAAVLACSVPAQAQTLKSLMYNTNGRFVTGTNILTFSNAIQFASGDVQISDGGMIRWSGSDRIEVETYTLHGGWTFTEPDYVRGQLGFATNLNTLWTATNVQIAFDALNLGLYPDEGGSLVGAAAALWDQTLQEPGLSIVDGDPIFGFAGSNAWRIALGLGVSNIVTFAGITNNGDITINNTTATNGVLFIRRTNNEPFLGLANLIASNNVTVSNETLFRVGVAEATNRSAQFGFRSTNTNGSGVAVFSVFGFNALMQIGADASTNAVIYSGGGTNNEVMTLIRDGATEFARPLRFSTNASTRPATNAPANTTNVAAWVEMRVGTNSYRVPLYQ